MKKNKDILFERRGRLAVVTLNRPQALNALTLEMCLALHEKLCEYEKDGNVCAVLIKGAGDKAFCAGGDIRRLYDTGRAGESYPREFYRHEYELNAAVFHFLKPYIAFMDGIVMGGGVGVSVHGSHRVVSERVAFAMPETGIGLFPDVGGSYFLSRLPGAVGMYMAMTGARLKAADAVHAGVGDAYVPADRLDDLEAALAATDLTVDAAARVSRVIKEIAVDSGPAPLDERRAAIDRCFSQGSVEAILAALAEEGDDWAASTAEIMRGKSPTSMKLAFRQICSGRSKTFNDCMRMEYRIANGCIAGHDFYEGVRAVVIDKDQAPKWQPATLEAVGDELIRPYFEEVPADGDLSFPSDAAH